VPLTSPRFCLPAALAAWLAAPLSAPLAAQDTGLGAAPAVSDAELADLRGKFVSPDAVRFFGLTLHSLWQDADGVVTAAQLGLSVWLGDGSAGPQVTIAWQRDGESGMDLPGFSDEAAGSYAIASGAMQTNVIAGSDNQVANRMSLAVVPASSLAASDNGGSFSGTATGTAGDGDTVSFVAGGGQFGLSIHDAQGAGTVHQGVASDPGQLGQSILLNSDHNTVTNTMNVTVGIDRAQMVDGLSLDNTLSAMKGLGF